MRIAFLSANREQLPDPVVPLGLLYVAAAVPDTHTVEFWDVCFADDPFEYVARNLASFRPDVVALGLRNVQSGDYSGAGVNVEYYKEMVQCIRDCSEARIVIGGGGFSIMPEKLMHHLKPDFGISGEGEAPFRELVTALERGEGELERIPSLHFFRNTEVVSVAPGPFASLDELAPPNRALLDRRYYEVSGTDAIQTKRGCPLRCDYCAYPTIEGRSIRQRSPAAVVDEIVLALEANPAIKHLFIVDSVFNLPPSHAKSVCRALIRGGVRLPWTCYANPIGFDGELAELMAGAHCAGIEVGSDSGVDAVLDHLKKGFRTQQIRDIHEHCAAAGILDCHTFILGTMGETLDDVRRTLDFCADLDPAAAVFMIWTDDQEALDPLLTDRRRAFRDQILEIVDKRSREHSRWAVPALGRNYDARLFRVLRRRGLYGPLWQHLAASDGRLRIAQPALA